MAKVRITLPAALPVLRPEREGEEFRIWFSNIIYPLKAEWDVVVHCRYGGSLGSSWRLRNAADCEDSFPLSITVYDPWGEILGYAETRIELYRRSERPIRLLCIGDSFTQKHLYIDDMAGLLQGVGFIGTRCFSGSFPMEGRGGWTLANYLEDHATVKRSPSPFVFPLGIEGKRYYGERSFREAIQSPEIDPYALEGYTFEPLLPGDVYLESEQLFRHGETEEILIDPAPQWEVSFSKYLERNSLERPDAVSILLGANDYQGTTYEDAPEVIRKFGERMQFLVERIRDAVPEAALMIHLPSIGAEQYGWGLRSECIPGWADRGCRTAKCYRYKVMLAAEELIRRFDGREMEGIYLVPSLLVIDPRDGFSTRPYPEGPEGAQEMHHENWVHPGPAGYYQIAYAMAGVVEKIRQKGEHHE